MFLIEEDNGNGKMNTLCLKLWYLWYYDILQKIYDGRSESSPLLISTEITTDIESTSWIEQVYKTFFHIVTTVGIFACDEQDPAYQDCKNRHLWT